MLPQKCKQWLNRECENLPGMKIVSKLIFTDHLDGIIKNASQKVNALFHITPKTNIAKQRLLINLSQFDLDVSKSRSQKQNKSSA